MPGNAFDGIIVYQSYGEYFESHLLRGLSPYILKHGTAPADDSSLQLPLYHPGVLAWVQFSMQLAFNMWNLITAWVEDGTEPGWLATNLDGNVRHSREAGLEADPLQYQLEGMAGRHSHLGRLEAVGASR